MIRDYLPVLLHILVAIGFAVSALVVSVILGKAGKRSRIKDSAYECGMLPQGEAQPRFSVKFYLVAMLFILFDLEIVFMYPWAVVYKESIVQSKAHLLEHAQFCFDLDGRLRLRAEKRRTRLEKVVRPRPVQISPEAAALQACVTHRPRIIL